MRTSVPGRATPAEASRSGRSPATASTWSRTRQDGGGHRRLALPEQLDEDRAEDLEGLAQVGRGERGAAVDDVAQAREVRRLVPQGVEQHHDLGRHQPGVGDPGLGQQAEDPRRIEAASCRGITWWAPRAVAARAWNPAPWLSGAACSVTSRSSIGVMSASHDAVTKPKMPWLSIAPLGRPVVPDV